MRRRLHQALQPGGVADDIIIAVSVGLIVGCVLAALILLTAMGGGPSSMVSG